MDTSPTEPTKSELRALVRERRSNLSTQQRRQADQCIQRNLLELLATIPSCGNNNAQAGASGENTATNPLGTNEGTNNDARPTVAAYVPTQTEPGGSDLPSVLEAAGFRVILPRVAGKQLQWVYHSGDMTTSDWGLQEPVGKEISDPLHKHTNTLIVPALAIDHHGKRLGQGGGFYDRALATGGLPSRKLAVVDHWEFRERIPHAPHDLTVNTVITERGVFDI